MKRNEKWWKRFSLWNLSFKNNPSNFLESFPSVSLRGFKHYRTYNLQSLIDPKIITSNFCIICLELSDWLFLTAKLSGSCGLILYKVKFEIFTIRNTSGLTPPSLHQYETPTDDGNRSDGSSALWLVGSCCVHVLLQLVCSSVRSLVCLWWNIKVTITTNCLLSPSVCCTNNK